MLERIKPRVAAMLIVVGAVGAACAELPSINANQCGNHIVDGTEDCDTFAPNGSSCVAAGNENECRFDCSQNNLCPPTYGCGAVDKICRRATGRYDVGNSQTIFAAANVMAFSDFDGDGRADALTSGVNDVRIHYFDGRLSLTKTLILPISNPKFHVGPMGNDTNADLQIFRNSGLVDVFRGLSDRTVAPVVYSSVPIPNTSVTARAFLARNQINNNTGDSLARPTGDDVFAFGSGDKGVGVVLDLAGRTLSSGVTPAVANQAVALPDSTVDKVAGAIAVGTFIEGSDCDQFAIGFSQANNVAVYTPCRSTNSPINPFAYETNAIGAGYVSPTRVSLPGTATFGATSNGVTAGAFAFDANGDGHLDLVIAGTQSTTTEIFIAYGLGNGTFSSSPTLIPADNIASRYTTIDPILTSIASNGKPTVPLAVGDLNHDKIIDFVLPGGIYISETGQPATDGGIIGPHYLAGPVVPNATLWTNAVITDLNRDGVPDVAAANPTGSIDFFMGTASQAMSYLSYGLDGTPSNLAVGDFDGDLTTDLAYSLSGVSAADGGAPSNEIQILFGQGGAFPAQPTTLGTLPSVLQLAAAPLAASYTGASPPANTNVSSMVALSLDSSSNVFAAVLVGNPDRLITSAFALFASETQRAAAVRGNTGAFITPNQNDLLMIARDATTSDHEFWYAPSTGEATIDSTKLAVGPVLPTTIDWESAVVVTGSVSTAGIQQNVVLGPPPTKTSGQPQLLSVDPTTLTLGTPIPIPCNYANDPGVAGLQNRNADFDGDGNRDFLVFCPDMSNRPTLTVFWADASGAFAASRVTVVPTPADALTSFAQARNGPVIQRSVVMLTANGVFYSTPGGSDGRTFSAPIQDPSLPGGIFINSADIDGDGVLDFGIVDATKTQVQFFRGIPINDSASVP